MGPEAMSTASDSEGVEDVEADVDGEHLYNHYNTLKKVRGCRSE